MRNTAFGGLAFLLLTTGCATLKDPLLMGAGTGLVAGAGAGTAINKEKGAMTGALIGLGVGAISTYLIHSRLESRDEQTRRKTLLNLEKYDVERPYYPGLIPQGGQPGSLYSPLRANP